MYVCSAAALITSISPTWTYRSNDKLFTDADSIMYVPRTYQIRTGIYIRTLENKDAPRVPDIEANNASIPAQAEIDVSFAPDPYKTLPQISSRPDKLSYQTLSVYVPL